MKLRIRPLFLLAATFLLLGNVAACFDDDDDDVPQQVQPFTITVPINGTTVNAIVGLSFDIADGGDIHSALSGTATSVSFTSASIMQITAAGGAASANVSYGSCNFTISSSSISGLPQGTTGTINPCNMLVQTLNSIGIGDQGTGTISLLLGSSGSGQVTVTVRITTGGLVQVNGTTVGTVTDGQVTGTTGTGGG